MARHAAPQTRCVALADRAGSNVFRHSLHRRGIPRACAAAAAAVVAAATATATATATASATATATATATAKVDPYPAADHAAQWIRITPPSGSDLGRR